MRQVPLLWLPSARGRPSSQLIRRRPHLLRLRQDDAMVTPPCLPSFPFSSSFPLPFTRRRSRCKRGKDPQLVERPKGTRLLGLLARAGQGSQGTAWGKAVPYPLPWRRRRSARAGLRAKIARGKEVNRGKGGAWASLGMRASCSACALTRPGSVSRRADALGAARLAVRWHLLRSEGEEEEQGWPACGSRLAVREGGGKGRWARLDRG
jgi:hypothetical protein